MPREREVDTRLIDGNNRAMGKELKIFDIAVLPLPTSEIPIVKPDLAMFPKPEDCPWIGVEVRLQEQVTAIGQEAAGVSLSITEPPQNVTADFAVACHKLVTSLGKKPGQIATEFAANFNTHSHIPYVAKAVPTLNGYVNFELDVQSFGNAVLQMVEKQGQDYGNENLGSGETVVIDCSSPNVAKYMSVGHLRSTVIGESLARVYRAGGYTVIRDNHLGDWGTQFGMLGKAKELWGEEIDREMPGADPVQKLYRLYVKINEEVDREKDADFERLRALSPDADEKDLRRQVTSALEEEGRAWFRRLEEGDPTARAVLKETTAQSLLEFNRVYGLLGSEYEYYLGESFYVPMLPDVVDVLLKRGVAQKGEGKELGAVLVDFPKERKINKLMIKKSDGTSLYSTRDLATLVARTAWFNPNRILYVVGGDQKDYFNQVFAAFENLAQGKGPLVEHVYFGMISLPEGKMSTRKGRVVFLEEVLNEAIARARNKVGDTNRNLSDEQIEQISRQIGVGAVIYMDLGQGRTRNIKFDWEQALSLEGNSAPYIQYAHARARSLLRKAEAAEVAINHETGPKFDLPIEAELIKQLAQFPCAIAKALETNEPSVIAAYTYKTADIFSRFYKEAGVLSEKDPMKRNTRLRLTAATAQVIKNGLYLLGIEAPEMM